MDLNESEDESWDSDIEAAVTFTAEVHPSEEREDIWRTLQARERDVSHLLNGYMSADADTAGGWIRQLVVIGRVTEALDEWNQCRRVLGSSWLPQITQDEFARGWPWVDERIRTTLRQLPFTGPRLFAQAEASLFQDERDGN